MNQKMPIYTKCYMTRVQHIAVYLAAAILMGAVAYLFYHILWVSALVGIIAGFPLERMYAASTVTKRRMQLRLQFRDFLEAVTVASKAGNVELRAIESALADLKVSYSDKADIVVEIEHMLQLYYGGGQQFKDLFNDLAVRSDLEDIKSFATVYGVIEGKSDRFADILTQTSEIIGDKIEIEAEIQTTISGAQSEVNMMLVMPILIVVMMSGMGGGLMDALFGTMEGHLAATAALIIFGISYAIAVKVTKVEV